MERRGTSEQLGSSAFFQLVRDTAGEIRPLAEIVDQRRKAWLESEETLFAERHRGAAAWDAHRQRLRELLGEAARSRGLLTNSEQAAQQLDALGQAFPFLFGLPEPPRPLVDTVQPGTREFPKWALPAAVFNGLNELAKQKAAAEKNRG